MPTSAPLARATSSFAAEPAVAMTREPGAAGTGVDEQGLAAPEPGAMDEAAPRRLVGEPENGAFLEGHEVGERVDVALIDRDHFGVAAPRHRREHALTQADLGHARADPAHDPRDLTARAERWVGAVLILALHDQDVGEVAADGAHLDEDLARVRPRGRRVGVLERRRVAPRAGQHDFHRILFER